MKIMHDDLENNYALTAEKHYIRLAMTLMGIFKRVVKTTNVEELEKHQELMLKLKFQNLIWFKPIPTITSYRN
jgi:hypothetical protein